MKGDWPWWLGFGTAAAMLSLGTFVGWAVFSSPVHADVPAPAFVDMSGLQLRIEALEETVAQVQKQSVDALSLVNAVPVWIKSEVASKLLIADEIHAKKLLVFDHDHDAESGRIVLTTAKDGSPILLFNRVDKTPAAVLSEVDGDVELALYDTAQQPRVVLKTFDNGNSVVRIMDEKGKPRLGMISTHGGEAEFIRFDKFGNPSTLK